MRYCAGLTTNNNPETGTMRKSLKAVLILTALALSGQALAQAYPAKPIKVIVGYAPGGSADAGIRPLAKVL